MRASQVHKLVGFNQDLDMKIIFLSSQNRDKIKYMSFSSDLTYVCCCLTKMLILKIIFLSSQDRR